MTQPTPRNASHAPRVLVTGLALACALPALWASDRTPIPTPPIERANPTVKQLPSRVPAAGPTSPAKATPPTDTVGRLKAVIERNAGRGGNVSLHVGTRVIVSTNDSTETDGSAHGPAPRHIKTPVHPNRFLAAVPSAHPALEPSKGPSPLTTRPGSHWTYEGANGPANWANVQPGFGTCATGERQSPVHIQSTDTLQGPAEALQFDYRPSGGSVVNNGQTIRVDLDGSNTLTVRGTAHRLVEFHFHQPAEEKVNGKGFAMVAHLVHQSAQGQLATLAVLIEPGEANPLIDKVWTHMPLEVKDRVALPANLLDMKQLLPTDQRYYQYLGSLTTPPCTEGVLWIVMKQPMTVSPEQLRLFAQLFPMNARPTQPLHGRVVREAM